MQLIKYISAIFLGLIFLVSSSGFMIFKSHCVCTGDEEVSLFIHRQICKTEMEVQDENRMEASCCSSNETMETNACKTHSNDCGCDKPEVIYFKLKNLVVNEDVKFVIVQTIQVLVVYSAIQFNFWDNVNSNEFKNSYIDPPPIISSSHDFLIQIQQLKIPNIA